MAKTTLAVQPNDVGLDFDVAVKQATVTQQRQPATTIDREIEKPGVARANRAVSTEEPDGTKEYVEKYKDYSVMQQHILFWDRDNDGQIYPWDTYIGFRELGFNIFFSLLAVLIINLNFSYPTRLAHSWLPDPFFRVYVDSVHKAKHGSDSGTYDMEGRFTPQLFENIFSKYDKDGDGALNLKEMFSMMAGHRCAADPFGWGAAFFEFGTTWLLIQRDGKIFKEDLRSVYDGSIFWRIRDARKTKAGWKQGFGIGGDGFFGATKVA
ncbi:hypothetical protein Plec18167_008028 [Paecilomyces lecythidis]|uniref:EF-hand domain-containing protein n=1 Tax=Paecilomyces lecythidis TaxID=3004212 RepID=A0ABR3X057_9EURO